MCFYNNFFAENHPLWLKHVQIEAIQSIRLCSRLLFLYIVPNTTASITSKLLYKFISLVASLPLDPTFLHPNVSLILWGVSNPQSAKLVTRSASIFLNCTHPLYKSHNYNRSGVQLVVFKVAAHESAYTKSCDHSSTRMGCHPCPTWWPETTSKCAYSINPTCHCSSWDLRPTAWTPLDGHRTRAT